MTLATAFFSSGTWLVIRNLLVFFAVVIWIASLYWIYKDARRRVEDPWLVWMAVLVGVVVPYFGPFIYMLFRPPEYLEDVRERRLEIKAMEDRLAKRDLHCPICTTKLRQACTSCKAPLEALWQVCPFCETPVEPAAIAGLPALEPRRRRRAE
jgi:hypothetical protein